MKKLSWFILLVIIATLIVLAVTNYKTPSNNPTDSTNTIQNQVQVEDKWTTLAKALTAQGVKVYGTYWCAYCQKQKAMFGDAWQYVNYVECADTKNPNKQTQACIDAKIEGYPTWIFADGSRETGALTYEQLSSKIN